MAQPSASSLSLWGFANLQGAREQNEDSAQVFYSEPAAGLLLAGKKKSGGGEEEDNNNRRGKPFVAFVHDGHSGDEAMRHLCGWLKEQNTHWMADKKESSSDFFFSADDAVGHMSALYTDMIDRLKGEPSGVVSIGALCQNSGVCFGWVGDCEGAIFNSDGSVYRTECQINDLGEAALLSTACTDPDLMPTFLRLGNRIHDAQLRDAITEPHSLLGSNPMIYLEVLSVRACPFFLLLHCTLREG